MIAEMEAMTYDEPQVEVSAEDIVQIPYTSGTESKPKGAMLSHRALMSQYHSCIFDGQYETDDVSLHALPLFHCAQLHCFLMPYLYIGATNVIMHKADPLEMIRLIEKYQITHMFAPPTVWIGILNHPEFKQLQPRQPEKGGLWRQHHAGGNYQAAFRHFPRSEALELLRTDRDGAGGHHPEA